MRCDSWALAQESSAETGCTEVPGGTCPFGALQTQEGGSAPALVRRQTNNCVGLRRSEVMCAEGTLECGGLTPPWD
jgi:hypothetical protein